MRYAVHRNVMLLLRGCALFYMPQDDCSAVLQGGSMTISGSSNMGGPPGLKISGLRIHVNLSLFQRVGIDQKWFNFIDFGSCCKQFLQKKKLLFNNVASKETWNPDSSEDRRFFSIDSVRLRVHLKAFSFSFFKLNVMHITLEIMHHSTKWSAAGCIRTTYIYQPAEEPSSEKYDV